MRLGTVRRQSGHGTQAGVSMIELLIAGVVMVVGFLGLMMLIMTAIATNNRNKLDTNSTLVAQMVLEEVRSQIATGAAPQVVDCAGHSWTIATASGGATVSGGLIDFSVTPPANYFMTYTVCTANGGQATYEVRWNIQALPPPGTPPPSPNSWLVTVGSRPVGATSNLRYFALPVTLRTIVGI